MIEEANHILHHQTHGKIKYYIVFKLTDLIMVICLMINIIYLHIKKILLGLEDMILEMLVVIDME